MLNWATRRIPSTIALTGILLFGGGLGFAPGRPGATVVARASQAAPMKGINVSPSMRPWRNPGIVNPDSWWDPARGAGYMNHEMPLLRQLNPWTVRMEFPWWWIQRRGRGTFDWATADAIVNAAVSNGIQLVPVLVYSPDWSSGGQNPPTTCATGQNLATAPSTPPSAADFGAFAGAIASRYRGRVKYWEMWNEPDLAKYFNGTPSQYANAILVPGYDAVKLADPSAGVVLGGPATANLGWLQQVLNAGGRGHFDVMAFHDYTTDVSSIQNNAQNVASLAAGKPVWLGEWGVQDSSGSAHTRLINSLLGSPSAIAMAQWWELRDDSSMASSSVVCKTAAWGLTSGPPGYAPKSSFGTFQGFPGPPGTAGGGGAGAAPPPAASHSASPAPRSRSGGSGTGPSVPTAAIATSPAPAPPSPAASGAQTALGGTVSSAGPTASGGAVAGIAGPASSSGIRIGPPALVGGALVLIAAAAFAVFAAWKRRPGPVPKTQD